MKRLFFTLFSLLSFGLFAQESIVGDWLGSIEGPQGSLRMVLHVTEAEEGGIKVVLDSPDQGSYGNETDTAYFADGIFVFEAGAGQVRYEAGVSGEAMRGTFKQGPYELALNFDKSDAPIGKDKRSQDPSLPYDYESQEVEFRNKKNKITLAGTLTYPFGAGPFPTVILISGSGPQDRNSEIFNHRPFWVWSDYLTSKGFAVLRYDDRGVGDSGGKFASATSSNFASDVEAAIDYLKSRGEVVDEDAIGLMGHSEGGLIAPIVAMESKDVSFMVLLAGPAALGREVLLDQSKKIYQHAGMTAEDIEENNIMMNQLYDLLDDGLDEQALREQMNSVIATAAEGEPQEAVEQMQQAIWNELNSVWMREFILYDPVPALEAVEVPVLALYGEKDFQVTPELNKPRMEEALKKAPVNDYQVMVMPNRNHLFQICTTCAISEYGQIDETVNEETMKLVIKWIRKHT